MKAIVYKKYGTPEVLVPAELEKPVPGASEVLIHVFAATVTSADCMMRRGDTLLSRILLGLFTPRAKYQVLGTEFAGMIEAVGPEVSEFHVGDEVYAFRGFGTGCYAEYKCMPAKGSIALKPASMSYEEAASVVDGASTALFFLKDKADIRSGQKVLINGASGSIGTFAVQLARYFGAEVTAVCGTANIEWVKLLGADHVLDYTSTDFTKAGEKYDIVFDTVGKSSFAKCRRVLLPGGKYLVTVKPFLNGMLSLLTKIGCNQKVIYGMSVQKKESLKFLRTLVEKGALKTIIDQQFPLEKIHEAHAYVEQGHKKGNVVINIR